MELDKFKEDDQVALRCALLITPFMSNSYRLCQLQKNKQGLIPSSKTSSLFRVRRPARMLFTPELYQGWGNGNDEEM